MRLLTINIHSHGSDFEPELYHQKMKALAAPYAAAKVADIIEGR